MKTNKQYFYKLKGKFATLLQQKQNIIRVQSTNQDLKKKIEQVQNKLKETTNKTNFLRLELKKLEEKINQKTTISISNSISNSNLNSNLNPISISISHSNSVPNNISNFHSNLTSTLHSTVKKLESHVSFLQVISLSNKQINDQLSQEELNNVIQNLTSFLIKNNSHQQQLNSLKKSIGFFYKEREQKNKILIQFLHNEKNNLLKILNKLLFEKEQRDLISESNTYLSMQERKTALRLQIAEKNNENRALMSEYQYLKERSIHEYTSSTDNNITDGFDSNNPNDSNLTGNEDRVSEMSDSYDSEVIAIGFDDSNLLNNTIDRNLNSSPLSIHENEHLKEFTVFDNPNSDSSKLSKRQSVLAIRIPSFQEIQENGISQIKPKINEESSINFSTLQDVLQNSYAVEFFKEYLTQQYNQENLMFYLEVNEFKKIKEENIENLAKNIYEKFVKNESLFEINIDSQTRNEISNKVEQNDFSLNMFDEAQKIIFILMDQNSYDGFKNSDLYEDLLKKLKYLSKNGSSSIKNAKLIFHSSKNIVLNIGNKFEGKARDPNSLSELLIQILIDFCNYFFLVSNSKIEIDSLSNSIPFRRFVVLTSELQNVNLDEITSVSKRKAFFLNIYNCLYLHAIIVKGIPKDKSSKKKFQNENKYNIQGMEFSLNDILNGILRGNHDKKLKEKQYFKQNDKRIKYTINLDPFIHFGIRSFDDSGIPLRVFYKENSDKELKNMTKSYISEQIEIDEQKSQILIPHLFQEFSKDFGSNIEETFSVLSIFLTNTHPNFDSNFKKFHVKFKNPPKSSLIFDSKYTSFEEENLQVK
ncbi:electron carrier/ protein disulfide oxidoreductase [Anaeramoeba ignava]|uniref:Electron carrier/ protein disulfide oxidoreductase n=1 Tax=Anaeramoeba ignava TaxID=1746090 RepID=A0A9Q0LU25_ANAIG|nr:electron carrier/ protein disulfide oxidoreductase [Anaeramoeba ignava]